MEVVFTEKSLSESTQLTSHQRKWELGAGSERGSPPHPRIAGEMWRKTFGMVSEKFHFSLTG